MTAGPGYTNIKQMCPEIKCVLYDAYMEPNELCIYHEKPLIEGVIKLRSCGDNINTVCDMFSGDFAWT